MLEDPDFEAKPLVMVMGQYSTGKTTFIRLSKFYHDKWSPVNIVVF